MEPAFGQRPHSGMPLCRISRWRELHRQPFHPQKMLIAFVLLSTWLSSISSDAISKSRGNRIQVCALLVVFKLGVIESVSFCFHNEAYKYKMTSTNSIYTASKLY